MRADDCHVDPLPHAPVIEKADVWLAFVLGDFCWVLLKVY